MRMFIVAAAAALAIVTPRAAGAQPISDVSGPDTYLQLQMGAFFPDVPSGSDLDAFDPGFAFGGTFGARFSPVVSAELGIGYVRIDGRATGNDVALWDVPITANLRLRAPFKAAEISVFGGVGLHFATSTVNPDVGDRTSDTAAALGAQFGAELAFNLSPTMRVGVEGMWSFANPRFQDTTVDLTGLRTAVTIGYHF
jgi:hypothetical protein